MKSIRFLAVLICALLLVGSQAENAGSGSLVHEIWIPRRIDWVPAPKDVDPDLSVGSATVLYFSRNGEFGRLDCYLQKVGEKLTISPGDGQNIYRGKWSWDHNHLRISYRLVYRTVRRVPPETLPGPWLTYSTELSGFGQKAAINKHTKLRFDGIEFVPSRESQTKDVLAYFQPSSLDSVP